MDVGGVCAFHLPVGRRPHQNGVVRRAFPVHCGQLLLDGKRTEKYGSVKSRETECPFNVLHRPTRVESSARQRRAAQKRVMHTAHLLEASTRGAVSNCSFPVYVVEL